MGMIQSVDFCLHLVQEQFGTEYSNFSAIFFVPINQYKSGNFQGRGRFLAIVTGDLIIVSDCNFNYATMIIQGYLVLPSRLQFAE